jgi:hypothetical protein
MQTSFQYCLDAFEQISFDLKMNFVQYLIHLLLKVFDYKYSELLGSHSIEMSKRYLYTSIIFNEFVDRFYSDNESENI